MTFRPVAPCLVFCAAIAGCGGSPASPSAPTTGPLTMNFSPQDATFAAATDEYRRVWAEDGARITETMERVAGLTFFGRSIDVMVFEGVSDAGSRDVPMRLRASYPIDTKRSALVHELGHRLAAQLTVLPQGVDSHRLLNLFLYDVWDDLWGRAFADGHVAIETAQRGLYDYESAWRWALAYDRAGRAARLAEIVASNRR